jgi:hypothetical protein
VGHSTHINHPKCILEKNKMPDDKSKIGEPDRSRVAGEQDYEVSYIVEKYGLSEDQVRKLITRFGNDREKIEAAARQLHSSS